MFSVATTFEVEATIVAEIVAIVEVVALVVTGDREDDHFRNLDIQFLLR